VRENGRTAFPTIRGNPPESGYTLGYTARIS
jgi:hypothetical protein